MRRFILAARISVAAARMKQAAAGAVQLTGHNPGNRRQSATLGALRQGIQQGFGIGMARVCKQLHHRLPFDLLAGVLHHHALGGFCDHAHIMGDQHQSHALFTLQPGEQFQNLRLNSHIERCCGLVGDQQLRAAGNSHGDHDPLTHTAGQLMRKSPQATGRIGYADLIQQFQGTSTAITPTAAQMYFDGLGKLKTYCKTRIQAAHRLLKNHGHFFTDDLAPLIGSDS